MSNGIITIIVSPKDNKKRTYHLLYLTVSKSDAQTAKEFLERSS
jgi:hypothetical protein